MSHHDSLQALGSVLRQTREARGLTIAEAAHDTYIRTQYLEALENGDLSRLPEPVYINGFLKRYADYLGLDSSNFLTQSLPLLNPNIEIVPVPPIPKSKASLHLRPVHLWAAYVALIMTAVGGLTALVDTTSNPLPSWMTSVRTIWGPPTKPDPVANRPKRVFSTLEQWTYIAGVFPATTAPTPVRTGTDGKPVQLDIRVVDRPSWVRVTADGRTVFEDIIQPGAQMNWSANRTIVLRAGNAGGILLTFNDQDLGVMGKLGEVKQQVFQKP